MSDVEEENFCFYGKPLDAYDEDAFPKKRPITVEEQIATDAQGRRRFHGAFTGGFSAGFFNTVGSLEGWLPGEFKSSRSEKFEKFTQKPEDFMDDEDLGEDGIAPQVIRATDDYNTSKKRKKKVFSDGPIPGEPVLHNILTSGNETIGYMLLKNLRVRDRAKEPERTEKVYGCQMPSVEDTALFTPNNQYEIPDIYQQYLAKPKSNSFGLGYSGLDHNSLDLFSTGHSSKLVVTDRSNKKLSITGQAFGVGAFEDEDDDIYMKEDMSKYDFELINEKDKEQAKKRAGNLVFDMFLQSKTTPVLKNSKQYQPPKIPHSFTGKHKIKKSRFEPIAIEESQQLSTSKVNPLVRAKYLGEEPQEEFTASKTTSQSVKVKIENDKNKDKVSQNNQEGKNQVAVASYLDDRFVSSSKQEDVHSILENVVKSETTHGTEQMRAAVKMKMFGPLTRITSDWTPSTLLCKRFNVPEPFVDQPEKSRTRKKNIIFEYQKHFDEITLEPGLNKEESIEIEQQQEIIQETIGIDVPELPPTEQGLDVSEPVTVKTESEELPSKPIDITDKIDLEQRQDLFKAIFLSDSEADDSDQEDNKKEEIDQSNAVTRDENRKEELKTVVLSEQLLPKIKPRKDGILSGIDFEQLVKPKTIHENNQTIKPNEESTNCYGPKIPDLIVSQTIKTSIVISGESDEEWIEKNSNSEEINRKKHKKQKKHKKSKHKKHEKKSK